ncbi:hypothetical protein ACNZ61_003028 [Enterococcus hirae]
MSELKKEILDLLILNGRKPQTIKGGERVVYLYDALNIVNKEFSKIEQPQLNENQKALVTWMQDNECYTGDPLESISDLFLEGTPSEHFPDFPLSCVEAAYKSLTNRQKVEMVQEYLSRYLEQEAK